MAKKKARSVKALDMAHVGYLPNWNEIDSYEDEKFPQMLNDALRHYGYFSSAKDMRKSMIKWLENNEPSAKVIKAYKKSLDWRTPVPAYSLACAALAGMPMRPRDFEYIMTNVHAAIAKNDGVVTEPTKEQKAKKAAQPSIQDRITAKIQEHILHIEETWEDDLLDDVMIKCPNPEIKAYLTKENVGASMIDRIVDHFQANWDEFQASQGKNADEQLAEAYAHLKAADIKRYKAFYTSLIADLKMYKEEKKVARAPRKRKPQSKTKQVAKLNYMKKHDGLKLVSVSPEDVIDCKELWVYQTKYRKLGKYVTDGYTTLGVKGTTIVGFDPTKSVQKTLRKPKEQLAEFKKAGKVKLRTFMDDVKAVDIKLTGRINKDTILLKVY